MTASSESRPPSRIRRWFGRAAGLILVVLIGWIAWDHRPLNSTERQIVGLWRTPGPGAPAQEILFTPDRRFVISMRQSGFSELHGTWSCSGERLRCLLDWNPTPSTSFGFWADLQMLLRRLWITGGRRAKWPVSILDADHLDHDGEVLTRTKVLGTEAE